MILVAVCSILSVAVILWILSFFMQDRFKQLEDQFEQFSISTLQETYQLKKKVNILEEELLINENFIDENSYNQSKQN
ncbi:hypothetical protein SAMN04487944_101487 [Gracilibacillus ureilyticus]|uniref:Uncharacterized protein n=1 Tax=Gracilibacillus ureilyticus TaxID=531814 RepID=A0A1H9M0U3_9BACI|nr:hypothetical protein [Gracilibacillus ureilyticus]SER17065.1 hypothetical protein SAMN04487944_101487 [Gracilibacillus ureilyticus]